MYLFLTCKLNGPSIKVYNYLYIGDKNNPIIVENGEIETQYYIDSSCFHTLLLQWAFGISTVDCYFITACG